MNGDDRKKTYWFEPHITGFGWGLPRCWQGWIVFWIYMTLALGSIPLFFITGSVWVLFGNIALWTTVMAVICWRKGPPIRTEVSEEAFQSLREAAKRGEELIKAKKTHVKKTEPAKQGH